MSWSVNGIVNRIEDVIFSQEKPTSRRIKDIFQQTVYVRPLDIDSLLAFIYIVRVHVFRNQLVQALRPVFIYFVHHILNNDVKKILKDYASILPGKYCIEIPIYFTTHPSNIFRTYITCEYKFVLRVPVGMFDCKIIVQVESSLYGVCLRNQSYKSIRNGVRSVYLDVMYDKLMNIGFINADGGGLFTSYVVCNEIDDMLRDVIISKEPGRWDEIARRQLTDMFNGVDFNIDISDMFNEDY